MLTVNGSSAATTWRERGNDITMTKLLTRGYLSMPRIFGFRRRRHGQDARDTIKLLLPLILLIPVFALAEVPKVSAVRCPDGGVQPQVAVDDSGKVHLIYLKG